MRRIYRLREKDQPAEDVDSAARGRKEDSRTEGVDVVLDSSGSMAVCNASLKKKVNSCGAFDGSRESFPVQEANDRPERRGQPRY